MWYAIDIRDIVSAVTVPTLILNRTSAILNPVEESRYLAERMPAAEYVELPGADHLPWVGDQDALLRACRALRAARHVTWRPRWIECSPPWCSPTSSTPRPWPSHQGDAAWKALAERHHGIVRAQLARYRGVEVDTAGDGFFATFDGPARAVRCAREIVQTVKPLGIEVRAGVHTGEVESINGKAGGVAVVIGARVGAIASASEVLAQLHSEGPHCRQRSHLR